MKNHHETISRYMNANAEISNANENGNTKAIALQSTNVRRQSNKRGNSKLAADVDSDDEEGQTKKQIRGKRRDFVKQQFAAFFKNTTFHGFSQVFESTSWFNRIFWLITICLVFAMAVTQLKILFKYFMDNPTVTDVNVRYPEDGMMLPNVTLCILCKMDKKKANRIYPNMSDSLAEFGMSAFWSAYSTALTDLDYFNESLRGDLQDELFDTIGHNNVTRMLTDLMFDCEYQFLMCWFENGLVFPCCKRNPFIEVRRLLAHSGSCFEFVSKRKQRLPGPVGGFGFVYWYPNKRLFNTAYNSYNEFALHMYMSPMDAMLENNPISIPIGYHSHINLQAIRHIKQSTDQLGRVNCKNPSLRYFANTDYSYQKCQVECLINTTLDHCNCTGVHYYGDLPHEKTCPPKEAMECYKKLVLDFANFLSTCRFDKCRESCDYWTYKPSLTVAHVFHPCCIDQMRKYWRLHNAPEQQIFRSLIIADVFYGDIQYNEVVQKSVLTMSTFISAIGGSMGLWTGASILTWVHLAYFAFSFCFGRRQIAEQDDDTVEHPHREVPRGKLVIVSDRSTNKTEDLEKNVNSKSESEPTEDVWVPDKELVEVNNELQIAKSLL